MASGGLSLVRFAGIPVCGVPVSLSVWCGVGLLGPSTWGLVPLVPCAPCVAYVRFA